MSYKENIIDRFGFHYSVAWITWTNLAYIQYMYIVRKIKHLFAQHPLEICRGDFLACFAVNAKKIYFYWQCTYKRFILQCQQMQNNFAILLKRAETVIKLLFHSSPIYAAMLILLPFALHKLGTRNALLDPWLNNNEVYLTLLLVLKITRLQDSRF